MDGWKSYFWRLILLLAGLLAAVSFLIIGFWKTLLILVCCGIGLGIGTCMDRGISPVAVVKLWIERNR